MLCEFVKPADTNVLHKAAVGLSAGGIASFMCCPIEVSVVVRVPVSFVFAEPPSSLP